MLRPLTFVFLLCGLPACGGTAVPPPPAPEHGSDARELEQGHLLLFPTAEAAALLARPVRLTEDGAWTIADERLPGCEVSVRETPAKYRVRRRVELKSLTAFSGTFGKLLGIEAGFGTATHADIDIENTAVLKADTRGDCDQVFVDQVFVGTGKRKLMATADAAAKAALAVPGAPSGGVDSSREVVDETAWDSPHAYAFTYREAGSDHGLSIDVQMPSSVAEGQEITLRIESDRPAYLVAYYRDAAGKGAVLWPSHQEPRPEVRPGAPVFLPSARERAAGVRLVTALREPGVAARESLVVYAFSDLADFERVRPAPDTVFEDGAEAAAALTARVDELPLNRWTRSVVNYVITPKGSAP